MIVKCRYCGTTLTEKDRICPSCGAANEEMAEFFKKQTEHRWEQEKINAQTRLAAEQHKVDWAKRGERTSRIVRLIFLVPLILIVLGVIIVGARTIKSQKDAERAEIAAQQEAESLQQKALELEHTMVYAKQGEWCEKPGYRVMVDDVRKYEFYSDHNELVFGIEGNTIAKDESRIAVHVVVENTSDDWISMEPTFTITDENSLQGRKDRFHIYTSFKDDRLDDNDIDFEGHEIGGYYDIASGNKVEGWAFFVVNAKSKTLRLRYCDYSEINLENPAYGSPEQE